MKKTIMIMMALTMDFIILGPYCQVVRSTVSNRAWAEEQPKNLQGIEFLLGYNRGELSQKQDYRFINFAVALDFNLKSLTRKIGFNPACLVQFQIEPFLGFVVQPESNIEAGTSFLFKLGLLPETWKFQPYIKGGTGMVLMSQHTLEQSTQFNFISSAGAGLHYFFKQGAAFTLEYRFRHTSNASMKQPNRGIDTHSYLFGITHLF
jgi:hypothetical protein